MPVRHDLCLESSDYNHSETHAILYLHACNTPTRNRVCMHTGPCMSKHSYLPRYETKSPCKVNKPIVRANPVQRHYAHARYKCLLPAQQHAMSTMAGRQN